MGEIVLKDGIKYLLHSYKDEVNDFEPTVIEHIKDIFGNDSEYFPKQKITTSANTRSIPDGFVVDFENKKWYIVELKLLCDDAIRRIRDQIGDYKTSIEKLETRRDIYKSITQSRNANFLDDLINDKDPEIIIIIDSLDGEKGKQFEEKVNKPHKMAKIIEFKTFDRGDAPSDHVHLFEELKEVEEIVLPKEIENLHGDFPLDEVLPARANDEDKADELIEQGVKKLSDLRKLGEKDEDIYEKLREMGYTKKQASYWLAFLLDIEEKPRKYNPNPPEKKKGEIGRTAVKGSVIDLIQVGLIKSGFMIYGKYKGKKLKGKIMSNGKIKITKDGTIWNSLSKAAVHLTGCSQNGWWWWKYKDENGQERMIKELREKLRKSN